MHLFEFMDHPRSPRWLRTFLLETLELCNFRFRDYYLWVAREIVAYVRAHGIKTVVELGAGSAPLVCTLAEVPDIGQLRLIACDLYPDKDMYRTLEARYPNKVQALAHPVDFTTPHHWDESTLLVLSAAFHHIPPESRKNVLKALTSSAGHIMIVEPLQKNPLSLLFSLTSVVPALLLPFFKLRQPSWLARALCCWVIPVVPLAFLWDGVVSWLRQWTVRRWRRELQDTLDNGRPPEIHWGIHSLLVSW